MTLGIAVLGTVVLQQFSGNITSQLTQRGVPASISATIANKIAAAGAQASQIPLSGRLPLTQASLHQAINQAFMDALHGSLLISGIGLLAAGLLVALFFPYRRRLTGKIVEPTEQPATTVTSVT